MCLRNPLRTIAFSGLCINDATHPVIMVNNSMSFARQIFTLFHELYHLISDTSGAEIIRDDFYVALNSSQQQSERSCDVFANAFMIPQDDFILELKKRPLSEEFIEDLAKLYSVSREAIMYTLLKMGKITPADYDALREIFYGEAIRNQKQAGGKNKSGGNYYSTKLSYLGQRYTGDVFKQYFSGRLIVFVQVKCYTAKWIIYPDWKRLSLGGWGNDLYFGHKYHSQAIVPFPKKGRVFEDIWGQTGSRY